MTRKQMQVAATEFSSATKHPSKLFPREIIPREWQHVEIPSSEADCAELINICKHRRLEMLRRLGRVAGRKRRRKLIRAYFRSESARIATLWVVATDAGETYGAVAKWPATQVVAKGKHLAVEAATTPPLWVQPSKSGRPESRPVFSFTTWDRARHTLAHDAMKATAELPEWMFLYRGGETAAKKWVQLHLPNAKVVLITDFPKCFPLLPWQQVKTALPISRRATEALLLEPWKTARARGFGMKTRKPEWGSLFIGRTEPDGTLSEDVVGLDNCAREIGLGRGIPPGSVLAPLAAQLVLLRMIKEVAALHADGVRLGLFADNLIIVLNDKAMEGPVRNGLRELAEKNFDAALAKQFCGRISRHSPEKFFSYLGRYLRRKKGAVQYWAIPGHCERIEGRALNDISSAKKFDDLKRPVRRLRGFLVHHGAAPNAADAVIRAALLVGEAAEQLRASADGQIASDLVDEA